MWHTVPCLANGYLVTSFLPGRHFSGPDDFSTQLQAWLKVVNRRVHRTLGARPADPWEADRAQMLTLPAVDPPTWWRFSTRMGRDHYVRVDTCDYSVGLAAIGHQVTVLTDSEGRRARLRRRDRRPACPMLGPPPDPDLLPSTPKSARRCVRKCAGWAWIP